MMRCATLPKSFVAEIAKEYHPKDVESAWYDWWESSGLFRPISDSNDVNCSKQSKFVVVLPPPNVTGFLHLGHALTGSVQDCLIRWHRMKGHNALYIPGSDHAGIATQVVVEKKLKAESQLSRHDLGRERFIEKVWEWKVKHGGVIQRQLRCLGLSLDWSREMFTMDTDSSLSVTEAFVRLYDDGILYRAKALINWCCTLKSAISDLEVEYIDVTPGLFIRIPNYEKTVEVGTITAFAYKVAGSDEEVIVETTRPETILGDVAVAVHPADARYAHLQGARLKCPFREDTIPLIFDEVLVDMNFGTGAVKVTPAHDPNDFECGKRQGLISVTIFDTEGRITTPGSFCGMHRYDCRRSIIKALDELQLLRGQRGHAMRLGICSRTGDIVEPFLMDQWFVNCSKMAVEAIEKVKTRELVLIPSAHEKTWYHWLEHIRPWCVSRQLWWGHRIPAYQCFLDTVRLGETDAEAWVVGRTEDEARSRAITKFALNAEEGNRLELRRDEDVLDTWFSSALWPLTLLGWPNSTQDLKTFFPTNLLETGHDILFFWVARMVMMSLHLTGQLPFTEVYMHAMVRDKNGEKMSKSKGNVIDPLDVLSGISLPDLQKKLEESNLEQKEVIKAKELQKKTFPGGIPECGADALRFGLLTYTVSGKNVNLDIDRIVGYRQFCNKLWNVVRYALYHSLGPDYVPSPMNLNQVSLPLECHWIRSRLDECAEICNHSFSKGNYDFSGATNAIYSFILHDFCDVFLELTKYYIKKSCPETEYVQHVLYDVLEKSLRLLHPMMPYVTEELWHRLPGSEHFSTSSIMVAPYPQPENCRNVESENEMKILLDVSHSIRSLKSYYQLTNKVLPQIWALTKSEQIQNLVEKSKNIIVTLSFVESITVVRSKESVPPGCGLKVINTDLSICILLKGIIDPGKEKDRLDKKLKLCQQQLDSLEKKMNINGYSDKVPQEIRKANDEKKNSLVTEISQIGEALDALRTLL